MKKIKVTQLRSLIRCLPKQRETMRSLGLRRIRHSVELELNPQVKGMLQVVQHLVKVEEI
jgi:large subunit ribosomal protein L30